MSIPFPDASPSCEHTIPKRGSFEAFLLETEPPRLPRHSKIRGINQTFYGARPASSAGSLGLGVCLRQPRGGLAAQPSPAQAAGDFQKLKSTGPSSPLNDDQMDGSSRPNFRAPLG